MVRMIYCHSEGEEFEEAAFRHNGGKLVVPYIHETDEPHYTSGERVKRPENPGTLSVRDARIEELARIIADLPDEHVQDVLDYAKGKADK